MSKCRRLPETWLTRMAEAHGATIMANDRVGEKGFCLAYHPRDSWCEKIGCYPVHPDNVRSSPKGKHPFDPAFMPRQS